MTFWLLLAIMTAAAMLAVLWPLVRTAPVSGSGHDVAIYRDQLRELERDVSDGEIGQSEADDARIEISRRLIAAADLAAQAQVQSLVPTPPSVPRAGARRFVAAGTVIAIPLAAGLVYGTLGSPGLSGQPRAARVASGDGAAMPAMLARIEEHLARDPDDGRGWDVVAPVYMGLERFDDAVRARRQALRLLGSSVERETALGEALSAAAQGIVTADAKAAFERAQKLDPHDPKSQFYLGLAAAQDSQPDVAARIWHDLLAQAPADAPWTGVVREALARVEPAAAGPGPGIEDMSAAAVMAPEQRDEMVRGMVERLAMRLREDGTDPEGWLRLLRAYMVLGERAKAQGAAAEARRALSGAPEKLRRLDDGIKQLDLEG
jgi:cytochrome c-type biogenesis protein CcmH